MLDPTTQPNPETWQAPVTEPADTATSAENPAASPADQLNVPVQPARTGNGRSVRLGIVAGVAALVVGGLAVTMAASPAPASNPGLVAVASASPAASDAPGPRGGGMGGDRMGGDRMRGGQGRGDSDRGQRGMGGMPGGDDGWQSPDGMGRGKRGGAFGAITITAVNGADLSVRTEDGWTRTITLTDATVLTRAGETITRSALKVGDTIRFAQTRSDSGTYSITKVVVVVPVVAGTVTEVTADGFTIKDRGGAARVVKITGATTYGLAGTDGTKADVVVGADVVVAGTSATDGAIAAEKVQVKVPRVMGQVTATSSDGFTITRRDGTTVTVHVSSKTTYILPGKTGATLSDVAKGAWVMVAGRQRADGSVDALTVATGKMRGDGPGRRGWDDPATPQASPATNG